MDPLTHSLTGLALARSGLTRAHGPGTTALLVVAANVPDIDALLLLSGDPDAHAFRRMATHSLLGLSVLALLVALFFKWRRPDRSFRALFGLALMGCASHSFLDLINSYGVVLFHPFRAERVELAMTFIIDLALWGILLTPSLARLVLRRQRDSVVPSRLALGAVALYLACCALGRHRCEHLLHESVAQAGLAPSFTWVFPEALGPQRFRGVARDGDTWHVYLLHSLSGSVEPAGTWHTDAELPAVRAARATRAGQLIEWFSKAPVWRVSEDGRTAEVFDLRFVSAVLPRRGRPFTRRLSLEPPADAAPP